METHEVVNTINNHARNNFSVKTIAVKTGFAVELVEAVLANDTETVERLQDENN